MHGPFIFRFRSLATRGLARESPRRSAWVSPTLPRADEGRAGFASKPGEYVVTDQRRDHISSIYEDAQMPYFMRLSCQDFGLHEDRVTGRPASHGCVRLPEKVARRLFFEVPIGTWASIK